MKVGVLATMTAILLVGGLSLSAQAGPAPDSDSDGTIDIADFCSALASAPSPCGFDADQDGYGNACDGDFNNDGVTDATDAGPFIADLGAGTDSGIGSDMNCDGVVDATDASPFIGQLSGSGVPGPSGLPCAGTVTCP
jgi:hypothetical protein